MGEATQRRLVRCAFLLFCLAPLLGVLGWSVVWAWPSHVTRIENRLRNQLGIIVTIDQVAHPRPNELELAGVQLKDPETRAVLARVNQLAIRRERRTLKLEADEVRLSVDHRARLWDLIRTHIVQQHALDDRAVQFHVRRADVTAGPDQFLYDVSGTAWSAKEKVQATVSWNSAQSADHSRFEIRMLRDRSASPLQTQIHIDTKQRSLPLALFSPTVAARLGGDPKLSGSLWVTWRAGDWQARFSGRLDEIELAGLTTFASDAYAMTGSGSVRLEADFTSWQLTRAVGSFESTDGSIDRKLIRRLLETQVVQQVPALPAADATGDGSFTYEMLALEFDFAADVVILRGRCASDALKSTVRPIVINQRGDTLVLRDARPVYSAHLLKCLRARQKK